MKDVVTIAPDGFALPLEMDDPIAAAISSRSRMSQADVLKIIRRTKSVDVTLAAMDYSDRHGITTADAVTVLRAQIDRPALPQNFTPAFGTWTPVSEALPAEHESVLGFCSLNRCPADVNEVFRDRSTWYAMRHGYTVSMITHWMPFPSAPTSGAKS